MIKSLLLVFSFIFITSCSSGFLDGNQKENMAKLDKAYGECNNPHRVLSKIDKKICEEKVKAAGPDGIVGEPINITDMLNKFQSGERNVVYANSVNNELWNASLALLEPYSLKMADSQGGFISTDWIMKQETPEQRCLIKINILSQELVSSGLTTKFICEKLVDGQWYKEDASYVDEEKQLTLKILELANQLTATLNAPS